MRGGLRAIAAIALLSGAGLGGVMSGGAGRRRFVRNPAEPRDTKTERARKDGRRKDPFFGIASRGRTGAGERMRQMEEARHELARRKARGRPAVSNPFKNEHRRSAYMDALRAGDSHQEAMRNARIITV